MAEWTCTKNFYDKETCEYIIEKSLQIKSKKAIVSTPSAPALTALPSEHSSEIPDSISDSIPGSTQKPPSSSITHPPPGKTVYAPAPAKKLKKKLRLKSPTYLSETVSFVFRLC